MINMINFYANLNELKDYSLNRNKVLETLIERATTKFNIWSSKEENKNNEIIEYKIIEDISKETLHQSSRIGPIYIDSYTASICINVLYRSIKNTCEDNVCPMLKLLKSKSDKEFIKYLHEKIK